MSHNTKIQKLVARMSVVDGKISDYYSLLNFWTEENNKEQIRKYINLINARFTELGY